MMRIKTCQFGLLFTGITDYISNVKCVNNNIHVIIYSIDIKTYQVTRKGTATSIKIGILHRQLSVTSMTVFSLFVIWRKISSRDSTNVL